MLPVFLFRKIWFLSHDDAFSIGDSVGRGPRTEVPEIDPRIVVQAVLLGSLSPLKVQVQVTFLDHQAVLSHVLNVFL